MPQQDPYKMVEKSPHYGELQEIIDVLFREKSEVDRMDVVVTAEIHNAPAELLEIISLLPPGIYERERLCIQLNSSLAGHAWGQVFGTVE